MRLPRNAADRVATKEAEQQNVEQAALFSIGDSPRPIAVDSAARWDLEASEYTLVAL